MGFFAPQPTMAHEPAASLSPLSLSAHVVCRTYGCPALAPPATAYADLPTRLRNIPAAACYCQCHEALARRGCTKMCDTKKRTLQWLATTCMKSRFQAPSDKSGTGPRFRRPDHAEHAQLLH